MAMAMAARSSSSACHALARGHDLSSSASAAAGDSSSSSGGTGLSGGGGRARRGRGRAGARLVVTTSSTTTPASGIAAAAAKSTWRAYSSPCGSFLAGYGCAAAHVDLTSIFRSQETSKNAERHSCVTRAEAPMTTSSRSQLLARMEDTSDLLDWDSIGFSLRSTDFMYVRVADHNGVWGPGELRPYGNINLSPAAGVINYGQGVFEGLKVNRTEDGRLLLFRPSENAMRMEVSGRRMCMPTIPQDEFVDAVIQTVTANQRWVPPFGKGSLYVRPLLIGSGGLLGLAPAPEYTFLIYVSPVGAYFKGGQLTPINLKVEENYHRAAPGGTGEVKTITNYSPVLFTQLEAKRCGYADVLYLDALNNKYVEEVSSCNIFVVKGRKVLTPQLVGTILPGITRKSILELAASLGYEVAECQVSVEDLLEADEVFCTGTAVVVSPVGSVTYRDKRYLYNGGEVGEVANELYKALTDLQTGRSVDARGWTIEVPLGRRRVGEGRIER